VTALSWPSIINGAGGETIGGKGVPAAMTLAHGGQHLGLIDVGIHSTEKMQRKGIKSVIVWQYPMAM
jgi:hypothetical protein